jgi:hypothetical protein
MIAHNDAARVRIVKNPKRNNLKKEKPNSSRRREKFAFNLSIMIIIATVALFAIFFAMGIHDRNQAASLNDGSDGNEGNAADFPAVNYALTNLIAPAPVLVVSNPVSN